MSTFDHLSLVRAVGRARTLDGRPAKGTVTFDSSTRLLDAITGQAIFPVPLVAHFDKTGSLSIDLPATNDPEITPVGWVYLVTINIGGPKREPFELAVPYDYVGSFDLFQAAPADDSGLVYVPAPAASAAANPLLSQMFGRRAWLLQSL